MSDAFEILLSEALRALFLITVPIVAGVALAGSLIAAVQGATSLHDSATAYACRLLAFIAVLYIFLPSFMNQIVSLAQYVLR